MLSYLEKHPLIPWLITLAIAIFIFYISSQTSESIPLPAQSPSAIPTIYHISIFFLFAFFLAIALIKGKNIYFLIPVIIIAILYGVSDEFHQSFIPGRVASLSDINLNTLGILASSLIYLLSIEFRNHN
jgi:VanZ family protein